MFKTEDLKDFKRLYYFSCYALNAIKRRIIDKEIKEQLSSIGAVVTRGPKQCLWKNKIRECSLEYSLINVFFQIHKIIGLICWLSKACSNVFCI